MSNSSLLSKIGFRVFFLIFGLLVFGNSNADQYKPEVAFAGFAYSGAASTIQARFPHTLAYEKELETQGTSLGQKLFNFLYKNPPSDLTIVQQIESLKGRDQALAVALVIGGETVSIEKFGNIYKLMVLIRGQSVFFDFKSMNVVRSYPISFAYIDSFDHSPSKIEIQQRLKIVYEGTADKPGILSRFVNSISTAKIPNNIPRFLQVKNIEIKSEALEYLPEYIKSEPGAAETWGADLVSEAISSRVGVPIIPYAKGYAIGNVMSMRISDGTVFNLNLPQPDYEISVEISDFKKVKFKELPGAATTYIYGAYAKLQIEEPLSRKLYLNTSLKNGEARVIPASQGYVDDFPSFYDALNGLFVKTAQAINGQIDEKWIRSASSTKDIDLQIANTKELMNQCR